jgi:hypothetical protein
MDTRLLIFFSADHPCWNGQDETAGTLLLVARISGQIGGHHLDDAGSRDRLGRL